MPSVCTFWQLPDEQDELLKRIARHAPLLAFEATRVPGPATITPFLVGDTLEPKRSILITTEPFLHFVQFDEVVSGGVPRVGASAHLSCVLGYSCGVMRGSKLPLSNLYAHWQYASVDGQLRVKDEAFRDWGRKVFGVARRWASQRGKDGYRATPRAIQAGADGSVELVPY